MYKSQVLSKNQNAPTEGIETDEVVQIQLCSISGKNQNAPIEGIETEAPSFSLHSAPRVRIKMPRLRGLKRRLPGCKRDGVEVRIKMPRLRGLKLQFPQTVKPPYKRGKNQNAPIEGIETSRQSLLRSDWTRKNQNAPIEGIETSSLLIVIIYTICKNQNAPIEGIETATIGICELCPTA